MTKCSVCRREDATVDRELFLGMCADCTDRALQDDNIADIAKHNNDLMKARGE